MATKEILRRGLCLLAGILAGAPAVLVASAANARAYHHHGTHAVHFASPGNGAPVLKRDTANEPRQPQDRKEISPGAPAKTANAPDFQSKDIGPIDTHISLQPNLHGAGPGTIRQAKSKIGPIGFRYSHVRHPLTPAKSGRNPRNAIGLSVAPQTVGSANNAGLVRSPTGAVPGGSTVVIKPNPGLDHFSHPGSQVTGPGAVRPALNGNGFVRRGFVPGTLGGPTKNVVVGINGSTIRRETLSSGSTFFAFKRYIVAYLVIVVFLVSMREAARSRRLTRPRGLDQAGVGLGMVFWIGILPLHRP